MTRVPWPVEAQRRRRRRRAPHGRSRHRASGGLGWRRWSGATSRLSPSRIVLSSAVRRSNSARGFPRCWSRQRRAVAAGLASPPCCSAVRGRRARARAPRAGDAPPPARHVSRGTNSTLRPNARLCAIMLEMSAPRRCPARRRGTGCVFFRRRAIALRTISPRAGCSRCFQPSRQCQRRCQSLIPAAVSCGRGSASSPIGCRDRLSAALTRPVGYRPSISISVQYEDQT